MLKCIAIDDEDLALELLADNINKVPYLRLAATCSDPVQAIHMLQKEKFDLVFLDIQMPGLTGLQLIQTLAARPMYIFVTAYENYALKGYELDVVDYLVKPVSFERFLKACNKALELYNFKNKVMEVGAEVDRNYFFVNADYSYIKIVFTDIVWIEGLKDYIRINLKSSSKPVVTRMSMKSIEEQLPATMFIRIHKSYVVSKDYITALRKSSVFINDLELPVGEHYKDGVFELIGKQKDL